MSVLMLDAVVGRAAVVRPQHDVAGAGVDLRAVAAVEAEDVGRGRAAVDGDDQRIALAGAIADRLHEHAADHRAVLRLPGDLFLLRRARSRAPAGSASVSCRHDVRVLAIWSTLSTVKSVGGVVPSE